MIQLYQFEVCPFCCKVRSVLDYKKLPYEKIEVNPINKEEIRFAKPYGKVPILKDGGQTLMESNDIIEYLDDRYPEKPVFSTDPAKKKKQKEWIQYVDEELVIILPPNIYRNFSEAYDSFKYITKVGNFPKWKRYFIRLGGAMAMKTVASKKMKERGITDPRAKLKETLSKWDIGLGSQKFMGGEKPDVADLVCHGVLKSVRELKVWEFIQKEAEPVASWYERVERSLRK